MKTSFYVEYAGKQVEEKDIIARVKELWVADGNKVKDLKTFMLSLKKMPLTMSSMTMQFQAKSNFNFTALTRLTYA